MSSPPERVWSPAFLAACATSFAIFFSFYLLLATLPIYITRIGGTESEVGLIIGVFSATAILVRLPVGWGTDLIGARPFILGGAALIVVCCLSYTVASTVALLLLIRVFHGAAWASYGTAINAVVADIVPPARRGEALGYFGMFGNLAMATGPALGIICYRRLTFPGLFAVSAVIGLTGLLLSLPLTRQGTTVQSAQQAKGRLRLANFIEPSSVFPAAVWTLMAMTYGAVISFLSLAANQRGFDNPGLFFSVYAIMLIIGRSVTGTLSDRFGRAAVIIPGFMLGAGALTILAYATEIASFLCAAFFYGLAMAALMPTLMALVVDRAAPNRRGAAMGTFAISMDLGIAAGSLAGGLVVGHVGYTALYLAAAGTALVALALYSGGVIRQSAERGAPHPNVG